MTSPIPGIKLLLEGAPGSGKTTSIRTWVAAGIEVGAMFTESSFDVVADIPCPKLHWVYIPPVQEGWSEMLDTMTKINTLTKKTLAGMEWPQRSRYNKALQLATTANKYVCQRCGSDLGDISKWGTNRVFFADSLSGMNTMFLQLVVGGNPMRDVGEWGIAIDQEEKYVQTLCEGLHCHMVLTAHLDRETDLVEGRSSVVPAALGNKLPTRIGRHFTDVVLARQQGGQFTWSSTAGGAELKARNFPLGDKLPADVGPALEQWKKRGGTIETLPELKSA